MLRDMMTTANVLLPQKGGNVGGMVEAICDMLRAPYMDGDRKRAYFGRRRQIGGVEMLERIAREGVPAEMQTEGNSKNELAHRNYRSTTKYWGEVLTKAVTNVALGRAKVFSVVQAKEIVRLWISPVGMMEKKNLRDIHNLTFRSGVTVRKGKGTN